MYANVSEILCLLLDYLFFLTGISNLTKTHLAGRGSLRVPVKWWSGKPCRWQPSCSYSHPCRRFWASSWTKSNTLAFQVGGLAWAQYLRPIKLNCLEKLAMGRPWPENGPKRHSRRRRKRRWWWFLVIILYVSNKTTILISPENYDQWCDVDRH
jgi:hypothetical protein